MGFINPRVSASTLILSSLPCCFYLFLLLPLCMAIDSISPSQSITDGETLVSAQGIFELGFFSPGNSTNRYVGIWFKKTSYTHVVWVLNSITPIKNSPGTLGIKSDGNLVLLDSKEKVLWYTNASSPSSNTVAVIDDLGNFALKEMKHSIGYVLWQSFDYPSNTLIPHMKLGGNDELGLYLTLTSWTSENNPASGNFFLNRDRKSLQQVFIVKGSVSTVFNFTDEVKHWRSGQWDGRTFVGTPGMSQDYMNGITFTSDGYGGQYYTYSTSNSSNIYIEVLDSYGNLVGKVWDEQEKEWVDACSVISSQCDIYGTCGHFGICNKMESSICSCMKGFQPKFPEKWRKGDWSDGCVRSRQLEFSSEHDGFMKMEGMKLPDFAEYVQVQDQNACQARCLKNCSCLAYAYISGPGCLVWSKDLIDVQQFSSSKGKDLFLRLPSSELGKPRKIRTFVIVFLAFSGAVSIALVTILYKLHQSKGKQKGIDRKSSNISDLGKISEAASDSVQASFLLDSVNNGEDQELQLFDFDGTRMATNNFCMENRIGAGGFGVVYKGDLPTGQTIAVKRLSRTSMQGMTEFKNEVMLISKLQHRNLVKLVGVCIEREEKLLLYEYLHNKSLDKFLSDPTKKAELDWTKRFRIIDGISCGLLYLHRDSRLRVIHRDLKASNILLDEDMIPKISDFGMTRIFGKKQDLANTQRVVGTYGYMAPEYVIQGMFSDKSDVFSFGVLLLEIVSGVKNNSFHHDEHLGLLSYAWQLWNDGKGMQFIDQEIVKSCHPIEAMRCIHIGLLCVQDFAVDRPTISKVVFMLSTKTTLPLPKMPAFIQNRNDITLNLYGSDACSINKCSITTIESR